MRTVMNWGLAALTRLAQADATTKGIGATEPQRRPPLAQRHATMKESVARWSRDVRSAVARMTATERERFYTTHATEALVTAMRVAALNGFGEAEREEAAREALASAPELRPFVDALAAPSASKDAPIVLIACSNTKVETHGQAVPAADVYASPLFRKSLAYAHAMTLEGNIRILSALHGVLRTTDKIVSYDYPMSKLRMRERDAWRSGAREQLLSAFGSGPRRVIVLAGKDYDIALPWTVEAPLEGKSIGARLQWLNAQIAALHAVETPAPSVRPLRPGRVRMAGRGRPWQQVEALAWDRDLFVHEDVEDPDLFVVTHAPTGRRWPDGFGDLASAIAFAARINDPAIRTVFDELVATMAKRDKVARVRTIAALRDLVAAGSTSVDGTDGPPSSQLMIGGTSAGLAALARLAGQSLSARMSEEAT